MCCSTHNSGFSSVGTLVTAVPIIYIGIIRTGNLSFFPVLLWWAIVGNSGRKKFSIRSSQCTVINETLQHTYSHPGQPYPADFVNEFIIRKLNPLLVVEFRFLSAYILACLMNREITREVVMKFLPAHFP